MPKPALPKLPVMTYCCSAWMNPGEQHDQNPPCETVRLQRSVQRAIDEAYRAGKEDAL